MYQRQTQNSESLQHHRLTAFEGLEHCIDHLHLSDAVLGRYAARRTRIQTFTQVMQLQGELKRRIEFIMRQIIRRNHRVVFHDWELVFCDAIQR